MIDSSSPVSFTSLALVEQLQRAVSEKGYTHPSPIQARAIPVLLAGRDLIGLAQTGTGKTAAFALPILQRLTLSPQPRVARKPRVLILTPTRELAVQIGESLAVYGKHLPLRHTVIFGGVGEQPQIRALNGGVDIVVATPGRLMDLMQQGYAALDRIEVFVLDEADRMLDMGFAPDVKRIVARLPAKRQSLLFSATMPESIRELANSLLTQPERVEVTPTGSTVDKVEQRLCHVDRNHKHRLLVHILQQHPGKLALVFTRTKHGANRLAKNLTRDGIEADAIHGNKSQGARQRALENFRAGTVPVLVATDIAARGIDVKDVAIVVNYELPEEPEAYVHRIGRTARAGASGLAIAFCDHEERDLLRDIQRLIRKTILVDDRHPFVASAGTQQFFSGDEPRRPGAQPHRQAKRASTGDHFRPRQTHSSGAPRQASRGSVRSDASSRQGAASRAGATSARGPVASKPAGGSFPWAFWRRGEKA
ncbi:MAG: DEAD/DEAH box helicase [Opitutaceae bacterium]|jgi:ATP-dependent RNA helicase RhlE